MNPTQKAYISAGVALFVGVIAAYAAIEARTFGKASMWFPAFAATVTFIAAVGVLVQEIVALRRAQSLERAPAAGDDDDEGITLPGYLYWMGWFVALFAALVLLGGYIGTAVWLFAFLLFGAKQSLMLAIIGPAAMVAALWGLHALFGFAVPPIALLNLLR